MTTKTMIDFRSDNTGRAAPELIEALAAANTGTALGYGGDETTAALQKRFSDLFEIPVRVYPVATGTAANALALAAIANPFGVVYCAREAHIDNAECNATSFFSGGAKMVPVAGTDGKIDPEAVDAAIANAGIGQTHKSQPAAINIVQATDMGAVYSVDEVAAIGRVARARGLNLHMDGARFANAVARLGCTPAEITWRSGVDILSFGVTKNGGLMADAIIVFSKDTATAISYHLRRAGQVWSKMRFASAQVAAYVEDDLWLRLARQSNDAAAKIAAGIGAIPGVRLLAPVQANELFVEMSAAGLDALAHDGIHYYRRGPRLARFVCRWDTSAAEIDTLIATVRRNASVAA